MGIFLTCSLIWLIAVFGETALFPAFSWFRPNLLFLFSGIFCLRWKGFETHFIAVFLGLTADSFSTTPFGVYGLSFLLISFLTRWYAIRVFQGAYIVIAVVSGVLTFSNQLLICLIINLFYEGGCLTFYWLWNTLANDVLPTVIVSIPCYQIFIYLESRYKIRLAERKF